MILNGWKEIASYLKVHPETAMTLAKNNGLPHSKIGGNIMTTTNLIEIWIIDSMVNSMPVQDKERKSKWRKRILEYVNSSKVLL